MFISCQLYKSSLWILLEGVQKGGDIPPYLYTLSQIRKQGMFFIVYGSWRLRSFGSIRLKDVVCRVFGRRID